jgi:ferredoxin-nitrite reductase
MEFLTPYRTPAGTLNNVEQWKLERHPLDVADAVRGRYAHEGADAIATVPGEVERLKWVGIYPQRQGGDAFMMRMKVPGGRLNAAQALRIGEITERFAAGPEDHPRWGNRYCDITTRQTIQIHWIGIADVPVIWDLLDEVGMTSIQACGDSARNVLGCPVAGVDRDEAFDATPIVEQISAFFTGNREYANLPRKFKMSVTGCLDDCAQAEINDIGLWPARLEDGTLGFNLIVGGGLSDGPRMASDVDVFVGLDEALECTRAIAQTFGELGNRENRGFSRMRYLVQELGPERFRSEIAARAAFALRPAGEGLTRAYRGDHVGVHAEHDAGRSYVGCAVPVGRLRGSELVEIARLAETYGDGGVRLTTDQNFVLTGVSDGAVDALLSEPLLTRYSPRPGPFTRGTVACTGSEFCRFAIVETKARSVDWAEALDRAYATAVTTHGEPGDADASEIIRLHFSGCSASCAQPQIADIGFRGETAHVGDRIVEAVDVALGGSLGADAGFAKWTVGALPVDDVPAMTARLVEAYVAERHPGERFHEWIRRQQGIDATYPHPQAVVTS